MTRPYSTAGLMVLGLALLASPADAQQRGPDPAVAEVRAVVASVGAGMEAGDFDALDQLFVSDRGLHIIEGAGVNHGWADYRDNHLKPELEGFRNFSYQWHSIEPQVSGETAFAAFRYDLSAETERGEIEIEGRGSIVLERRDGRWMVVHLHTSGRPVN